MSDGRENRRKYRTQEFATLSFIFCWCFTPSGIFYLYNQQDDRRKPVSFQGKITTIRR